MNLKTKIMFQYFICFGWIALSYCYFFNHSSVSILHMFRLNSVADVTIRDEHHRFNTSYVSVEFSSLLQKSISQACFNTSYVSVEFWIWLNNLKKTYLFQYFICFGWIYDGQLMIKEIIKFQYFICFGWITRKSFNGTKRKTVSILHMFRLNPRRLSFCKGSWDRFNTSYVSVEFIKFRVFWRLESEI